MKSQYKKAQKDESIRQKFLDEFFLKNKLKTIPGLIYDNNYKESAKFFKNQIEKGRMQEEEYEGILESCKDEGELRALAFTPRNFLGKGGNNPIFVRPEIFNFNYEDFVSVIVDHEYKHIENMQKGIFLKKGFEISYLNMSYFDSDVLVTIDECVAYENQLRLANEKNYFSDLIKESFQILKELNENLKKMKKFKSITEENAVRVVIEENERVLVEFGGNLK